MHNFEYRQGELYCEQVPVSQIAKEIGTPCYIYSHATLTGISGRMTVPSRASRTSSRLP